MQSRAEEAKQLETEQNIVQLKDNEIDRVAQLLTDHSGFNVMDFRNSALFSLSDFKSAPLSFGKSYNKN